MLRTYEGQKDEIHICVIPYNKPKTAQFIKIPVYALSLMENAKEATVRLAEEVV